jgi:hypothetical protein
MLACVVVFALAPSRFSLIGTWTSVYTAAPRKGTPSLRMANTYVFKPDGTFQSRMTTYADFRAMSYDDTSGTYKLAGTKLTIHSGGGKYTTILLKKTSQLSGPTAFDLVIHWIDKDHFDTVFTTGSPAMKFTRKLEKK